MLRHLYGRFLTGGGGVKENPKAFNFRYLAYADYLVFCVERKNLATTLKKFEEIVREYGLVLNAKKSGIFCVKTYESIEMSDVTIPVVSSY